MAADLNERQRRFAHEYVVDLNGKQAAIRAGYAERSAEVTASRLLCHAKVAPLVQSLLDDRAKRTNVTADRVVAELAAIAFADLTDIATWGEEGELLLTAAEDLPPAARAALREVYSTTSTVTFGDDQERSTTYKKVKQHDKLRALELLGRHLGMFKKDVDVKVSVGITLDKLHELAASASAEVEAPSEE